MDIELARTFLAILETGNFGRAGDLLQVTQSTISTRIKTLESLLGRPVFIRGKAGVSATVAGRQFRRHAETMIRAWQQARQEVALPNAYSGVISVGGQFTLWDRLLLSWIGWMRRTLPDIAVRAEVASADQLMRQIVDGTLDIVVIYSPQARPGLVIESLIEEPLVLVGTDAGASGPNDPDYVFVDWGPDFAADHSLAFPDLPSPGLSVSHGPLALHHILADGGSAYFPMRLVRDALADGRLHLIEGAPRFRRPVFMVHREGETEDSFNSALAGLRAVAQNEAGEAMALSRADTVSAAV